MLIKKVAEINLDENAVYIVKNGQIQKVESPKTGFGSQEVIWQNDQPIRVKISATEQF